MTTAATATVPHSGDELPAMNNGVTGYVSNYFAVMKDLLDAVDPAGIEQVVELLVETFQTGKRLVICGNGGSASTASHLVCDLSKNIFLDTGKPFEVVALTDSPALITAWGNDTEYANVFAGQAKTWLREGDVLLAISGSGNSPNIVRVVEEANAIGAITVGFCGYGGGKLGALAKMPIVVHKRNMQQVEDLHMIFGHVVFSAFRDRLKGLLS